VDTDRQAGNVLRFGEYEADLRAHELRRKGIRIRLQEQPYRMLTLLLESPGELISREHLRESLWPGGTFVDFEHSLNTAVNKLRAALGDDPAAPRFVETVPRLGYRFIAPVEGRSAGSRLAADSAASIAVLPFANLSADKENEYFSDGLAEEILNALAQIAELRVAARTSAFFFRDKNVDVREIGARLNVDHVLEGSVRREGEKIRVTVQLISAADGYHLWSERYECRMAGVFDVQDQISRAVSGHLRVQLAGGQMMVERRTGNLEAYNHYLKGRHWGNRFTGHGWRSAVACFEQAISVDADFAPPYAGLAVALTYLAIHGWERPREVMPRAKKCALKAVELDETLAEAHCALGLIRTFYEWDWAGAEIEYQRAMELNPGDALIRVYRSLLLMYTGRTDSAFAEAHLAWERDPISAEVNRLMVYISFVTGRPEDAVAFGRKAVELYPHGPGAHNLLGFAFAHSGQYQEAMQYLLSAKALADGDSVYDWGVGYVRACQGRRAEAISISATLKPQRDKGYFSPTLMAGLYGALGEFDLAFDALEEATEERDGFLVSIGSDPTFAALRSDPRWPLMLRKINLA